MPGTVPHAGNSTEQLSLSFWSLHSNQRNRIKKIKRYQIELCKKIKEDKRDSKYFKVALQFFDLRVIKEDLFKRTLEQRLEVQEREECCSIPRVK